MHKFIRTAIFSLSMITLQGCHVVTGDETVMQYSRDARITAAVKSKFVKSDEVPTGKIHVETEKGVVQLSGFVSNVEQKARAEQLASSVKGVRSVRNNIVAEHYRLNEKNN